MGFTLSVPHGADSKQQKESEIITEECKMPLKILPNSVKTEQEERSSKDNTTAKINETQKLKDQGWEITKSPKGKMGLYNNLRKGGN